MNQLKSKSISALIWDFLGKVLTQGSGFVVTIVLARLLEPSDFGAIAMIMVVVGIAQVFSDVGLGSAIIQRKRLHPTHFSSVFFFNMSIASVLTLLTYFSAQSIATFYQYDRLTPLLEATSVLFILNGLSNIQTVKLRKELNYSLITKIGLVASIASGIAGILSAVAGFGVWSLIIQILSHSLLNTGLLWVLSGWLPRLRFSMKALKQLWAFGFRMFLVSVLNAITERADYLVIGKLFSSSELGFFQRAKSLNTLVIKYSSSSLMSVLFPVLSKIQNDTARVQKIVLKALNLLSLLVFLLIGGLYLSSEALILFLFGSKWSLSIPLLQGLLLSAFAYPLNALLVNILSSRGNSKAFLKMAIIKKSIFMTNLVVAFQWGLMEYLYGLVVVGLINTSISIYFAAKEIRLKQTQLHQPIIAQMLVGCLSLSLSLFVISHLDLSIFSQFFVANSVFVITFFTINIAFRTMAITYFWDEFSPIVLKKFKLK